MKTRGLMLKVISASALFILLVSTLLGAGCSQGEPPTPATTPYTPAPTMAPTVYTIPTITVPPSAQTPKPPGAPAPRIEITVPGVTIPSAGTPVPSPTGAPSYPKPGEGTIGLAVGGAKDIGNFRENIENGYLPLPTDITCEGLFYDYYFDTGQTESCDKLFCPSFSTAVTRDPFSGERQYYLSVGLNSGMKEKDFERKDLNLVVVLDISGSMRDGFNTYYYDSSGQAVTLDDNERATAKLEVAKDAIISLLGHLEKDDRFCLVVFNNDAFIESMMESIGNTDMDELEDDIMRLQANGGTNLSAGMNLAARQFDKYIRYDKFAYENRVIFITDAMPNLGQVGHHEMLRTTRDMADENIFSTFIGVGVDFNSELIEYITDTKGSNYYSVHSPRKFRERLDDEFDYMVTPLVFDLRLYVETYGWEIEEVYGSPEADRSTGEVMKVNTLFPSNRTDGETRGGIILLKMNKLYDDATLRVKTSYEDRYGRSDTSVAKVYFDDLSHDYFDNSGIQKGVLLARYADLMKNWIIDEREHAHYSRPWEPRVDRDYGIVPPPKHLGTWERTSMPLFVSPWYEDLFEDFADYFDDEMHDIGDKSMRQEMDVLKTLYRY